MEGHEDTTGQENKQTQIAAGEAKETGATFLPMQHPPHLGISSESPFAQFLPTFDGLDAIAEDLAEQYQQFFSCQNRLRKRAGDCGFKTRPLTQAVLISANNLA